MTEKSILGLSLGSDWFSLAAMSNGCVQSVQTREVVQSFDFDTMRKTEEPLSSHVELLSDLYQRSGVSFRNAALSLSSDFVMIKKTPVALGLDDQVSRQIIEWEADQMMVSPMEQFVVDSDKLSMKTKAGNSVYLIVLIRKKIVRIIRQLAARAGLRLTSIDVDLFSSIRTVKKNYEHQSDETLLLIDVKNEFVELIVIHQDEYLLSQKTRYADVGIHAASTDTGEIADFLLKEIKRLLFGHLPEQSLDDLGGIYLTGNESARHLEKELDSRTALSVQMVNPFKKVKIAPDVTQSGDYLRYPERFVSCVGVL